MARVIKATEKDIDKIVELIDKKINSIELLIERLSDEPNFNKEIYVNELRELKLLRRKMIPCLEVI